MRLMDLLAGVPDAQVTGNPDVNVNEVRDDSRQVESGDLFVAISGTVADGRKFVADAAGREAAAIVLERSDDGRSIDGHSMTAPHGPGLNLPAGFRGTMVTVPNGRHALALIAGNRFASARALILSAVTGTNGKTTTTYLLESMLAAAGIRSGVVGTIEYRVGGASEDGGASAGRAGAALARPAPLTTPGALALHALFADMHRVGATDVVLEASSHALDQGRLDACRFRVAGLTNVTQDHLDYHRSMERYFDAKAILFERLLDPQAGVAVLPVDLVEGRAMRARLRKGNRRARVIGVAAVPGTADADVVVDTATFSAEGVRARLATPVGAVEFVSPLVGDYNLANIVLAVGMAIGRGLGAAVITEGLQRLKGVPGRLERVHNHAGVLCLVDYAHTPDALERALITTRPLVAGGGRLVTVFGCGGDRDRGKRPLMGEVAAARSDLAIVTSDNPRSEDPDAIIDMIVAGVRGEGMPELQAAELARWTDFSAAAPAVDAARGFVIAPDRRTAIQLAVSVARPGDVLLIAGKGHEDYQIVGGDRLHFDDREEALRGFALRTRAAIAPGGVVT